MKIPQQLHQFNDEPTLVVVAGKQGAVLYRAWRGLIETVDRFVIPKPHYSDREGEFKTRGRGKTVRSGAVRELRDSTIIADFLRELKRRVKYVPKMARVYIIAPSKAKNAIARSLPTWWQKQIRATITGNYYRHHPLAVVAKISRSTTPTQRF